MSRLHSFSELLSVLLGTLLACVFFGACMGGGGGGGGHGGGGSGGGQNLPQVTITSPNGTVTDGGMSIKGITATVTNDPTNAGVTWVYHDIGSLSDITTTSVTYNAPPPGGNCPWTNQILQAISNADSTSGAHISLTINCLPSISPTLPLGNVGGQYTGSLSVSGGTGAMTWALTAGSLPPGLTWSPSGTTASITGTSTQAGTFTFTFEVTDSLGGSSGATKFSITIEPGSTTACVLAGHQYAFLISSISSITGVYGTDTIGGINIASDGSLTAEFDSPFGPGTVTVTDGRCSAGTVPNTGTITFTSGSAPGPSGPLFPRTFSFAMRGSDLASGEIIETDSVYGPGAGEIELQTTPPAFAAGSYAFGFYEGSAYGNEALVGTFCSNSNSSLTFLQADVTIPSSSPPTTDFSSSGTGGYTTPDSYGRFTTGATPFTLSDGTAPDITFYAVGSGKAFAMVSGGRDYSGGTPPPLHGEVTGQPGSACPQEAGSFSNNSLSTSVFNLKAYYGPAAEVGLVDNINPSAGTLTITADQNFGGTSSIVSANSIPYSISGAGRGILTTTDSLGNQVTTIFYLDGLGNAYLLGQLNQQFAFGVATAQGTNAVPVTGTYASGQGFILPEGFSSGGTNSTLPVTQVALDATALTLTDQTAGGSSGSYIADTNNPGRYTATLDNTVTFGDTSIVFYVVDANKIVTMGLTSTATSLADLLR